MKWWFTNIFSTSAGCLKWKIVLMVTFAMQKFFSLMYSNLFIFAFVAFAFGMKSKNYHQDRWQDFPHAISSESFRVSDLMFKNPFELNFLWNKSLISFLQMLVYRVFVTQFIEKTLCTKSRTQFSNWTTTTLEKAMLALLCILCGAFSKTSVWHVCGIISGLSILIFVSMCRTFFA